MQVCLAPDVLKIGIDTQGLGIFLSFLGAWFAYGQCAVNFLLPFSCHCQNRVFLRI